MTRLERFLVFVTCLWAAPWFVRIAYLLPGDPNPGGYVLVFLIFGLGPPWLLAVVLLGLRWVLTGAGLEMPAPAVQRARWPAR